MRLNSVWKLRRGFLEEWPETELFHFCFFWPHCTTCVILVRPPGIEPVSPALAVWSLNQWTTREVLKLSFESEECASGLGAQGPVMKEGVNESSHQWKKQSAKAREGFPGEEPICQCRRWERHGFDPWVRKIPWRRAWQPPLVFLSGESHGQKSLEGCNP